MAGTANKELMEARARAVTDMLRSEMLDVLRSSYDKAVEAQDEDTAAEFARKIRNKLLANCDAEVALDRLGLSAPTLENSFSITSWIGFLQTLANVLVGEWAQYRQALRDLPEQEGFPFNIQWPVSPDYVESQETQP